MPDLSRLIRVTFIAILVASVVSTPATAATADADARTQFALNVQGGEFANANQPFNFSVWIHPYNAPIIPTGKVNVTLDAQPLAQLEASAIYSQPTYMQMPTNKLGIHTITASYDGDAAYAPVTTTKSVAVIKFAGPSFDPAKCTTHPYCFSAIRAGASLMFGTVAASSSYELPPAPLPSGNIDIYDAETFLASVPLVDGHTNFQAADYLRDGKTHCIRAVYNGDANYEASPDQAEFCGVTGNPAPILIPLGTAEPVPTTPPTTSTNSYRVIRDDGAVFSFGATPVGDQLSSHLSPEYKIVGATSTATKLGFWIVTRNGAIFLNGDAQFFGSMSGTPLNKPVVGMASTPTGNGYWLVASDGGIFAFGDAPFFGSTGSIKLNQPIVAMQPSEDGNGYRLVARDGGIFCFGNSPFLGTASLGSEFVAIVR